MGKGNHAAHSRPQTASQTLTQTINTQVIAGAPPVFLGTAGKNQVPTFLYPLPAPQNPNATTMGITLSLKPDKSFTHSITFY